MSPLAPLLLLLVAVASAQEWWQPGPGVSWQVRHGPVDIPYAAWHYNSSVVKISVELVLGHAEDLTLSVSNTSYLLLREVELLSCCCLHTINHPGLSTQYLLSQSLRTSPTLD